MNEERCKPDSAAYLTALKNHNTLPQNCMMVENAVSGMMAARNAGMKGVMFTKGTSNLYSELADYTIKRYNDTDIDFIMTKLN